MVKSRKREQLLLEQEHEATREEAIGGDEGSITADETTDVSCKSQMVIVLQYIMPDLTVTERFLEFVEVKDKTGVGLSNNIKAVLEPLKLKEKLIAQTYDGAAVMSGNVRGVQTVMKETYPNAQFVHCYAHQLNLTRPAATVFSKDEHPEGVFCRSNCFFHFFLRCSNTCCSSCRGNTETHTMATGCEMEL
ncbi:hypothetical protein JOQ06_008986 [Pogonophryne albipinna]|uniref:DUF4371 domain-containing protein n=1 Tax=Pogonophryne albipinna TaxID=1090488 RepID=A0AAD6BNA2_9TELE|nr:hypothetical protein JOQ06_008986 [Pogonophryne albipinna]